MRARGNDLDWGAHRVNWGVLDLPGPEFLKLYAITFTGAFLLSLVLGRLLRPRGQPAPVSDPEELAYLAGPVRLADTVIAKLIASGAMSAHPKIGLKVENAAAGRTAAERAVLQSGLFPGWKTIQSALAPERERLNDRLVSRGLMVAVSVAHRQRLVACLPILAVMLLGIVKLAFGIERDKPVAFLAILLVVSLALLLLRMSRWKRLTDGGAEAMASAAQAASRLRQAPVSSEAGVAVALFGTGVLASTAFADYHRFRAAGTGGETFGISSGSDSGCSSSDGGGGCGGCGGD